MIYHLKADLLFFLENTLISGMEQVNDCHSQNEL